MSRRRAAASIVASPVLVGAVTVLVVVVAVFLAYNANTGLPFVPTYNVAVEVPGGANLVEGNEVRAGGFRVGVVDKIRTKTTEGGRAVAVLDLQLDKTIEPISLDTRVIVRPRSALGLKYVELTPGSGARKLKAGATLPMANASRTTEFDDFLNTFDEDLRANSQISLQGFGDTFAGRGPSINEAIAELPRFFEHLTPVMEVLSDPETEIDEFFRQLGGAARQAAPVAAEQAEMFTHLADTFEAISADPEALRATIEKAAPTMDAAIRSFQVQRPFLADFADLSNRLRPAAQTLNARLPAINRAIIVGQVTQRELPRLNENTEDVLRAIDDLAENPNTLLALKDLTTTTAVTRPFLQFVAPYQTVCNYANYFFTGLGDHQSEELTDGYGERVLLKADNRQQDNRLSDSTADRPVDVPANQDPQAAQTTFRQPLQALHAQAYTPAVDSRGNADCLAGQTGYMDGPLATGGRYPPENWDPSRPGAAPGGGSHVVLDSDAPGRAGPTFTGVPNLRSVDRDLGRR